jgi:transposase-like protein
MWTNQTSIKVVVDRALKAVPPYCPNEKCPWHQPEVAEKHGSFVRYGTYPITRYPYISARFRCQSCRKVFSSSFFSLSYRDRTKSTYSEIANLHLKNWSKRQMAEEFQCSLDTVLRRFQELSSQSLLIQAKKTMNLKIEESLAYDGIENFSFSQYDPNNINHVIGRESYFVYDFNFSAMNRKGRTSQRQKIRMNELNQKYGRYDGKEIQKATRRLLARLLVRCPGEIVFHSDNHYAYRRAIASLPDKDRVCHLITLAKISRNFRNRLFAINHLDFLTRHHLAAFRRETVAFAKHSIAMIESFSVLMAWKNFMRPIFVKKHKRDPLANKQSPAMRLGIEKKILSFHEFFRVRVTKTQVTLNEDWQQFVERKDPTSRQKIAA